MHQISITTQNLQIMMTRIGFKSEIKAREALAFITNVYQQNGYVVSAGSRDKAKVFIDVPESVCDEVVLNYKDCII